MGIQVRARPHANRRRRAHRDQVRANVALGASRADNPELSLLTTQGNAPHRATLSDQHPLPGVVLKHRKLSKLLTTYVRPLGDFKTLSTDGSCTVIRTSLNQTNTGTGRLSSSSPNLQNLPSARQDEDASIVRQAFTARGQCSWRSCLVFSRVTPTGALAFRTDARTVACFTDGHVLIAVDYSQVQHCTRMPAVRCTARSPVHCDLGY